MDNEIRNPNHKQEKQQKCQKFGLAVWMFNIFFEYLDCSYSENSNEPLECM